MSNYRHIAQKIPADYRAQIIEGDWITKARPDRSDELMKKLFVIWGVYVNPGVMDRQDCAKCWSQVLGSYREIEDALIELAFEDELLDL